MLQLDTAPVQNDVLPLSRRYQITTFLRLGFAITVGIAAAMFAQDAFISTMAATVAYAAWSAGSVLLLQRSHATLIISNAALFADGAFLQWVLLTRGSWATELWVLAIIDVIAVSLLLSFATGIKTALIHCSAACFLMIAADFGVIPDLALSNAHAITRVVGLLVIAALTATITSINEAELRRSRSRVAVAAALSKRIQDTRRVPEAVVALLDAIESLFPDLRSVALIGGRDTYERVTAVGTETLKGNVTDETQESMRTKGYCTLATSSDGGTLIEQALPNQHHVLLMRLGTPQRPLGLIAMAFPRTTRRLPGRAIELLLELCHRTSTALNMLGLLNEVNRLATTDELTGLVNRRNFNDSFARLIQRARITHRPVALVMLDIDHFKSVNDTHGHQAGDDVLRKAGLALRSNSRPNDIVARLGGEELAVLLPECSFEEATAVAERYRHMIAVCGSAVAVTASAGVAMFPNDGTNADEVYQAADAALYQAKRSGRDRLVHAGAAPRP